MIGATNLPDRARATEYLFEFLGAASESKTSRPFVLEDRIVFKEVSGPEEEVVLKEDAKQIKEVLLEAFKEIELSFHKDVPREIRLAGLNFCKKKRTLELLDKVRSVFVEKVSESLREEFDQDFREKTNQINQVMTPLCLEKLVKKLETIRSDLKECVETYSLNIQKQIDDYLTHPPSLRRLSQSLDHINLDLNNFREELSLILNAIGRVHKAQVPLEYVFRINHKDDLKCTVDIGQLRSHLEGCDIGEDIKTHFKNLIDEINQEIAKIYESIKFFASSVEKGLSENFEVNDYRAKIEPIGTFEELFQSYLDCLSAGTIELNVVCRPPKKKEKEGSEEDGVVYTVNKCLYALSLIKCYQKDFLSLCAKNPDNENDPKVTIEWVIAETTLGAVCKNELYAPFFRKDQTRVPIVFESDLWMFKGLKVKRPTELCELANLIRTHEKVLDELCRLIESYGEFSITLTNSNPDQHCLAIHKKLAEIDLYVLGLNILN